METWDTGYMSSFSWRIINGQHVYEDFIYKFPPVTIYLHAFFMKILPETGQFFYFRIIAYLSYVAQVYFFVSGIYLIYSIKKIDKWALIILCFLVSWYNFPPYAWPTTDGIFFSSIAFWIIARYKNINFFQLFLVALCSLLAALSKQSFYLIPIMLLIWIYFRYGVKYSFYYLTNLLILIAIFTSLICSITSWNNFKEQISGTLALKDLYIVGFHNYIFLPIIYFISLTIILISSLFIFLKISNFKINYVFPYLKNIAIVLILISIVLFLMNKIFIAPFIAFDATIIALLYIFLEKKKSISYLFPLLVLLSISWSVSISIGYATPLLFATGIILSFIVLMENEIIINKKYYLWIGLPMCLVAFASNKNPYRDNSIFELNYSLESISPKLKFIKTNKETFEKHKEVKELIKKYGQNYIVAPSMPMSNYLFNGQSELPGDWLLNNEINSENNKFIKMCSNKKNFIFVEKSFITKEDFSKYTIQASPTTWFIYKNFNKIDETKYFIIYNGIN
ncbi:hypothetical protein [Flavobacterium sp.]|uniref:hypothetical protein n=1 Tax=Flavobacterium sp. TaxID=239 RepID=UPI003753DFA5